MDKPTLITDIDFNEDPSVCYYSKKNLLMVATGLIHFAVLTLRDTYKIVNLNKYNWLIDNKDMEQVKPFINNYMIDNLRIVTALENFMKALLIANGRIIHKIKHTAPYKDIHKLQKQRPVLILELFNAREMVNMNGHHVVDGILNKTLSIDLLLSEKYQEVIKLPPDILRIAKQVNKERNNIHLLMKMVVPFTPAIVDDMKKLREFVADMHYTGEKINADIVSEFGASDKPDDTMQIEL